MLIRNYQDVKAQEVPEEGAQKATVRWVLSEKQGAENFFMRIFEIEPNGCTPSHQHPWEHEMFIFYGTGRVVTEAEEVPISEGSVIFIAPHEWHQIKNNPADHLKMVCLIPSQAVKAPR